MDVVGGYLNFYTNKENFAKEVLEEVNAKQENYGSSKIGENKNIVIDYSSPNIAKPFHIGHLRSTVIGGALYNIYKFLGYNTIGINHLGDWGTQFGKLIEGYTRWGSEYNIEENPIDELTKIYVRINLENNLKFILCQFCTMLQRRGRIRIVKTANKTGKKQKNCDFPVLL